MRTAGQRFVNGYTGKPREGMGFHTTCIRQAKTVGNLSLLYTTSLAELQSGTYMN